MPAIRGPDRTLQTLLPTKRIHPELESGRIRLLGCPTLSRARIGMPAAGRNNSRQARLDPARVQRVHCAQNVSFEHRPVL